MTLRTCLTLPLSALLLAWAVMPAAGLGLCEVAPGPSGTSVRHASGFLLTGLGGVAITCRDDGVTLVDPDQPERTTGPVVVRMLAEAPPGPWPLTHELSNTGVAYTRLEEGTGGSGGISYTLTAWRVLGSGVLLVAQQRQFEPQFGPGLPSDAWEQIWSTMAGARAIP